jgi:NAD(P)-dependent dehydrogenase (short-subunit alcohol dehydrogenase family)
MIKKNWSIEDMPDQTGKTVLITGANDGLGCHLTVAFARKGARVIMACRDMKKAKRVQTETKDLYPGSEISCIGLDLGDLQSVASCADAVLNDHARLDVIMCNAGIMAVPFGTTKDGFELHMGVNYYGHYVLVGRLMPVIATSPGIRVVTTSSFAEKIGKLDLDSIPSEKTYHRWRSYGDSKLAMLMFSLSLNQKLRTAGVDGIALCAHPGYAKTNLRKGRLETEENKIQRLLLNMFEMMSMSSERGSLPLLCAATDPEARGGQYIGVSGLLEIQGSPKLTEGQKRAYDEKLQERLWSTSERLTGVKFPL